MARLFRHELAKILFMPVLWVFVVLCVVFNIFTTPTWLRTVDFDISTPFQYNVFENHNTSEIAEAYISALNLTGRVAERMRAKYATLQYSVDEAAISGHSFSPYFGEHTSIMHISLFHGVGGVMGRLLMQGLLLAALLALLAVGYEQINSTEHMVYATKTGRRILLYKISASITAGIGVYLLLAAVTFAIYFAIFDYSGVWGGNVSSGFNYIVDFIGILPFTTWRSFTVLSYFWASFGVGLGLVLCFSLLGVIIGTLSKNGYIGFLMVVLVNALCLAVPLVIPRGMYVHFVSFHTPIWLWFNSHLWFTDGGAMTLWLNFELWGMGFSLITLTVLCVLSVKNFEKRNIA